MAKINYEKIYGQLTREKKSLLGKQEVDKSKREQTEIPEDFNLTGFNLTKEAVKNLLQVMEKYEEVKKPNSMTPQFYKTLYNRVCLATEDITELVVKNTPVVVEDYEQACMELMNEIKAIKEAQ